MIYAFDAARNVQAATTLAAGIAAPPELRAQLLQQIIDTQSYAGLVQTVTAYMNGRNQQESTASLIQAMAGYAFAVRLGATDLNTLVAAVDSGRMTFGDVAVLAVTGIKSSAWVQTFANKLAAAEQLTSQLVASGKSADYNSAQTFAAVREWLGGVGLDSATGNAAKASIGSLLGLFDKGSVKGTAMDGYVAGASVFIDNNGNGVRDNSEVFGTTGAGGAFQFAGNTLAGALVLTGGTDIATGLPMLLKMTALAGSPVINPMTTMVQTLIAQGLVVSVPEAESKILAALKLPTLDLSTYDPIAAALQAGTTRQEKADAIAWQSRTTQLVNTLSVAQSILEPLVGKSTALQDALWLSLAVGVFNAGNAGDTYLTSGGKAFTDLLLSTVTQLKGPTLAQSLLAEPNTAKVVNAASEVLSTLNGLAGQAATAYANTQTPSAVDALSDVFKVQALTQSQIVPLLAAAVQGSNGMAQLVNFPLLAQLDGVKAGQITVGLDTTDGSAISNVAPPPPPPPPVPEPEPAPAPLPPPPAPAPVPAPAPPPDPVVSLSAGTFNGRPGINDEFTLPAGLTSLSGITINGNAGDTDVLTLNAAGTYILNDGGTGGTISHIKAVNLAGTGPNTISFPAAGSGGISTVNGGAGDDTVNLVNTGTAFLAGEASLGQGNNTLTLAGGAAYTGTLSSGSGTTDKLVMLNGSNISGAAVTGFETLSLGDQPGTVTLTAAQFNAFTSVIEGFGDNTLAFTTAGIITAPVDVEGFTLDNGTNTFTAGTNTLRATGGTGDDTFNYSAQQVSQSTFIDGGAGADTLNIGSFRANLNLNNPGVRNIETINATGSSATGYTLTNANGAGVTLNFAKGAAADTVQLGSGGQTVNVSGALNTPVTIQGGSDADTITLQVPGGGRVTIGSGSNQRAVDTIVDFNPARDVFKTGVAPNRAVGALMITNADTGDYITNITNITTGLNIGFKRFSPSLFNYYPRRQRHWYVPVSKHRQQCKHV